MYSYPISSQAEFNGFHRINDFKQSSSTKSERKPLVVREFPLENTPKNKIADLEAGANQNAPQSSRYFKLRLMPYFLKPKIMVCARKSI